ncbi:hypothetical protein X777_16219 [Ooceraea biroi]|uniref:Uncharacterized protein n=1 Tax=Ooceraea biroi TaxID=2015173 RepID=A0A026WUU8_OOCBI|nr:hypothetical protein X777_16219 [Ooceraea biroi]
MGCSTNLDILQKQLTFNVSSWFSAFNIFVHMLEDPSNVDKAIDLFINNFANISRLEPNPDVMEYHMTIIQFIDKCNNEDQLQKMEAFAKQHGLRINNDLTKRRDRIPKIKNTLSEIRNAFEKKQFSPSTTSKSKQRPTVKTCTMLLRRVTSIIYVKDKVIGGGFANRNIYAKYIKIKTKAPNNENHYINIERYQVQCIDVEHCCIAYLEFIRENLKRVKRIGRKPPLTGQLLRKI